MEDLEAGGVGQEQLGAAVAHNVRRLVGQEPRADWRVREPGAVDGPEHFEEVGVLVSWKATWSPGRRPGVCSARAARLAAWSSSRYVMT